MVKNITIILGLVSSFIALANNSIPNYTQIELEILDVLQAENTIDQQQYKQLRNRALERAPVQKSKALGGTATINGHVQNAAAMDLDVHNITLYELVDGVRTYVDATNTDMSGNYFFTGLTAGAYFVNSGSSTDDYLNYQWDSAGNVICTFCPDSATSQIILTDPGTINNIDFTVALGGVIEGTITDAITSDGVGTLYTLAVNTDTMINYRLGYGQINPVTGAYSIRGVPDGNYRVYLDPNNFDQFNAYIPQVYGGPECSFCSRLVYDGTGTVLTINLANTISNIDFSVNIGASFSGNIVDNDTLNPVMELGFLLLFSDSNYYLGFAAINGTNNDPLADGSYAIGGLLPGSYYVQGGDLGREFYQRELYNNRPCYYTGCNRGLGDAVVLSALENEVGINFLLNKGGKISGTVTDAGTGLPIVTPENERFWVEFYDASETVIGAAFIKPDGTYISARGLPVGDYSVRTGSMFQGNLNSPYVNQKYNDISCAGLACDLSATNVTVVNEITTTGIDFALTTGNSFSGTVTDLTTSAPIGGVHVLVYKDMGAGVVKFANWATTSNGGAGEPAIGTFEVNGLPDGTYYARTGYGSDLPFFVSSFNNIGGAAPVGWIDILYDSMPCLAACDVTTGTPIVLPTVLKSVAGSGSGSGPIIDFSLTQGGIITGQARDFIDEAPLTEITINVYNDQGAFMGSSISDGNGNYITRGLPIGNYYLTTSSFDVLLDVKYGNEFCIPGTCNPLDANPITIASLQQEVSNKDFILKTAYLHMYSDGFE